MPLTCVYCDTVLCVETCPVWKIGPRTLTAQSWALVAQECTVQVNVWSSWSSSGLFREMCLFIHQVTPRAPTRLKTCGSRLGSLYYDNVTGNITTLASLPKLIRLNQPTKAVSDPVTGRQVGDPPRAPRPPPAPPRGTGTWCRVVVGAPRNA